MHGRPDISLPFQTGALEQPIKALTPIHEFEILPICYFFNSN